MSLPGVEENVSLVVVNCSAYSYPKQYKNFAFKNIKQHNNTNGK